MEPEVDEVKHSDKLVIDTAEEFKTIQELKLKFWVVKLITKVVLGALGILLALIIWFVLTKPTDGILAGTAFENVAKIIVVLLESAFK